MNASEERKPVDDLETGAEFVPEAEPVNEPGAKPEFAPAPEASGRRCGLVSSSVGYVCPVAEEVEAQQVARGEWLLGSAADMLEEEPPVSERDLRMLARKLSEGLRDVVRVAESRGARLEEYRGGAEAASS